MEQQAAVAQASVALERLGLDEALSGVQVAQAGLHYADVQLTNATEARDGFASVRWELLEFAEAEAWSQAAAVDEDDEVHQTWRGNYYNASSRDRCDVLQDLAYRRTLISHDLEASRLQREVDSANAYKGIAQAQVAQAQARVAVAEQRVAVAQLQARYAQENCEFLDLKEFGARMWYELARVMRKLSRHYLDMAIEIAALMERAYEAETGRNLRKICYDYRNIATGNLLGADILLRDIDYFTFDYIATTKTKKAPVKISLSLADLYPMAFDGLKRTGTAFFETTLEQFDRLYPGLYLQKLQNVEVIFVGTTGNGAVCGTLRNIGVSKFRTESGAVKTQVYPSDVLPLSQYDIRNDALVFRYASNELRLFENNGIATMWQLQLPLDANDFDRSRILDIQIVLCFDAFFSRTLETSIRAALPTAGNAARVTSLKFFHPDEFFYLRNQGQAVMRFEPNQFPFNQTGLTRTALTLRVQGPSSLTGGLKVRLHSAVTGTEMTATLGPDGTCKAGTAPNALAALLNKSMMDTWTARILAEDNPGKTGADGKLDLAAIADVQAFQEYRFTYRT